jgi:predicted component of type VI protein secretion system
MSENEEMEVKLIIISPEITPNEFRLPLPITIGRSREAKIKLVHGQISRLHCEIFESDGKVMVKDLGSLNGTFLDGKTVSEAELLPNAILVVGAVTLKAVYESARTKKAVVKAVPVKAKITDTVKVTETIQSEFVDPLTMPGPEFTKTLASFPTLDDVDEIEIVDDELQILDDDLEIIEDDAGPNGADRLSIEEVAEDNSGPVFTGDDLNELEFVDDLEIVDDVEISDPDDAQPTKSSSAEDVDDMFDEWLEPEEGEEEGGKGKGEGGKK